MTTKQTEFLKWFIWERYNEVISYCGHLDVEIANKPDGSIRVERMKYRHLADYLASLYNQLNGCQ